MQAHKDIYAAIAQYLHNAPVALLRLSQVSRAAHRAVAPVFHSALVKRAFVGCKIHYADGYLYQVLSPCIPTKLKAARVVSLLYTLTWGELSVHLLVCNTCLRINIYVGMCCTTNMTMANIQDTIYRYPNVGKRQPLAAVQFAQLVFPGAFQYV